MSEPTPEQQDEATELWLRKQADRLKNNEHLNFLINHLDKARDTASQYLAYLTQESIAKKPITE